MNKTHLIKDENLGGVLREYVEVDRKVYIGDYVLIKRFEGNSVNHIANVVSIDSRCNQFTFSPEYEFKNTFGYDLGESFVVLEPTDIVRIDGQYYRMVERKAEVGEKVIVINKGLGNYYKIGGILNVTRKGHYSVSFSCNDGVDREIMNSQYFVLEPIKPTLEELTSKITDENKHEPIEKYTKEWNYVCEINENKTLIIPDAVNVEMVTEGVPETFVKFLDVNNEIVCLYKLNEIKGLYKNQIL